MQTWRLLKWLQSPYLFPFGHFQEDRTSFVGIRKYFLAVQDNLKMLAPTVLAVFEEVRKFFYGRFAVVILEVAVAQILKKSESKEQHYFAVVAPQSLALPCVHLL